MASWLVFLVSILQTAHLWANTGVVFRELSFSMLECGVHDRLDHLHIYPLCGIFYFPWHRHQIEGTNGVYCLIRKTRDSQSLMQRARFLHLIIHAWTRCHGLRVYPVCMCNTVRLGQVRSRHNLKPSGTRVTVCECMRFACVIRSGYLVLANQHTSSEGQSSRDLRQTRVEPY